MKERWLAKTFDEAGCLTNRRIQSQRDGHEPSGKSFFSSGTVNKFSLYLSSLVLERMFCLCLLEERSEEKSTNGILLLLCHLHCQLVLLTLFKDDAY